MAEEQAKSWERAWSTEEIKEQSANWNLAGDAGLLKHLQEFSQGLLARTHATETTLDTLVEQLRGTSAEVKSVTNQFLCLANTQFVESRVYDDDEKESPPEDKKEEEKPKSKEEQEGEVVAMVREALDVGISVLDSMFEVIDVPASDSEDEESGGRVVLEPHNPYLTRPLPYLIGSQKFLEDENVGLESPVDSEESAADKNLLISSDSDSEANVISNKRTRMSSTSSSEESDLAGSDTGPAPEKHKKMDTSPMFGSVPPANTEAKEWEPEDDGLFGQQEGKFSGGGGLFDDLEDSPGSLYNDEKDIASKAPVIRKESLFGAHTENEDDVFREKEDTRTPGTDPAFRHSRDIFNNPEKSLLFAGDDLDESNLFASSPVAGKDDVQSEPVPEQPHVQGKKKPVGGVSMFGTVDVFKAGIRIPPPASSSSSEDSAKENEGLLFDAEQNSLESTTNKKISLFNGDDDSLFSSATTKVQPPANTGLFQDEVSHMPQGSKKSDPRKPTLLFSDSDSGDDLLFSSTSSTSSRSRRSQASGDLLDDKPKLPPVQKRGLFDDEDELFGSSKDEPGFDIFGTGIAHTKPRTLENGNDSLFGKAVPESVLAPQVQNDTKDLLFGNDSEENYDIFRSTSKSKEVLPSSLFSDVDDLFSEPVSHVKQKEDAPRIGSLTNHVSSDDLFSLPLSRDQENTAQEFEDETNNIFSIPKSHGSIEIPSESKPTSADVLSNSYVASVDSTVSSISSLDSAKTINIEQEGMFSKEVPHPPLGEKPVVSSKPVIKQKPKAPLISKPSVQNESKDDCDIFSSVNPAQDNNIKTETDQINSVEKRNSEQGPTVVTKPEPPKTLNIRKTTGLLFSSSSNEDEDLFKMPFARKENISHLEDSESKPVEKRSTNEEEGSSNVKNSPDKLQVSPRKLHIDPTALLPGARPPMRSQHNSISAVGFESPAQVNATLHSIGKERPRNMKRRPPSRKARQEAVRNSEGFELPKEMNEEIIRQKAAEVTAPVIQASGIGDHIPVLVKVPSAKPILSGFLDGSSNLLSPSTDEEDMFGVPQDLPLEYDSNKSLFNSAPVLSPLEVKASTPDDSNTNSSVDTMDNNNIVSDKTESAPNATWEVYDVIRNTPPLDIGDDEDDSDLFGDIKKTTTSENKNKNFFVTPQHSDNLFTNPETDSKKETSQQPSADAHKNISVMQNAKKKSEEEMFSSTSVKDGVALFPSSIEDDNLFSAGAESFLNRISTTNSNMFQSRENSADNDDSLFSYKKDDRLIIPQEDLFSSKEEPATSEKLSGSSLFGGESPEGDDLFFATSSKTNISNSTARRKSNDISKSSIKSSLFDDCEDDDLFGNSSKSSSITKPAHAVSLLDPGSSKKNQGRENSPSQNSAIAEDLFEDPLMVLTKK